MLHLFIIQVITVIIIIIVLRTVFYRQLNSALTQLKKLQEENAIKETQLKEELERAKKERQAEIEKGKEEAQRIINDAKKAGQIVQRSLEDKAKEKSQHLLDKEKQELAHLKQDIVAQADAQALELSLELVRCILSSEIKEHLHHSLIQEVIDDTAKIGKEKFSVKQESVKIISSYALLPDEKERIKQILSEKLDTAVTLSEQVQPDIIGGLIIEIGSFIIDGSLNNKLEKAAALVKKNKK